LKRIKTIPVKPIPLFVDKDRDFVTRFSDCNPYNPYEQGIFKRAVGVVTGDRLGQTKEEYEAEKKPVMDVKGAPTQKEFKKGIKEQMKAKETIKEVETRSKMTYIIVKLKDGKWEKWGAYTRKGIEKEINRIKSLPYVERVLVSDDQNYADKLNRQIMIQQAKKAVKTVGKGLVGGITAPAEIGRQKEPEKTYAQRQKFAEHMREGIRIKPEGRQTIRTIVRQRPAVRTVYVQQPTVEEPSVEEVTIPMMPVEEQRQKRRYLYEEPWQEKYEYIPPQSSFYRKTDRFGRPIYTPSKYMPFRPKFVKPAFATSPTAWRRRV